jgi:tetratricopeptide (TPR) repeat protein
MQHNENMNDLEYLASLGYEKIPFDKGDLQQIKRAVRARSFSYSSGWGLALLTLIVGIFIGVSVFFAFFSSNLVPLNKEIAVQGRGVAKKDTSNTEVLLPAIEILPENFILKKKQVVSLEPEPAPLAAQSVPADLLPMQTTILPNDEVKENKLKFMPNAPVTFIHDLKVTSYALLYFRKNKFIPAHGLSPEFANASEQIRANAQIPESAKYYLHEELARGLLLFKKERYNEAIPILVKVAEFNDNNDLNCSFYIAMSYYNLGKYEIAAEGLAKCAGDPNNTFLQEALYYRALALQRQQRDAEARILLKQIVEEGEFYSGRAAELLRSAGN